MRIFITGGAGYIGTAVTRELACAGHDVVALVRTEEQAARLRMLGATPVHGDLANENSYRAAAETSDVIVHLANPPGDAARTALRALLDAAKSGRARRFVYTSVLFVLGDTPDGADEETPPAEDLYSGRASLEREVLSAADDRLSCAVIRPGMVYGGGEGGSVSDFFSRAKADGVVRYVGDGENRWSLVHRDDVASLFRIVVENDAAGIFHATDDEPLRVGDVAALAAAAAGEKIGVENIALEEASRTMGAFARALCLDQPVASPRSRSLGWTPAWKSFRRTARAAFEEFLSETEAHL